MKNYGDIEMKRKQAIKKMYDYEGTIPKAIVLPKSGEVIHSWYIVNFPDIVDLEKKGFNILHLYDKDIDGKIFVKDRNK